jgi:hypothetical protein
MFVLLLKYLKSLKGQARVALQSGAETRLTSVPAGTREFKRAGYVLKALGVGGGGAAGGD